MSTAADTIEQNPDATQRLSTPVEQSNGPYRWSAYRAGSRYNTAGNTNTLRIEDGRHPEVLFCRTEKKKQKKKRDSSQ